MWQATGDERLRQRVDYIVDKLAACQAANGNGYVAAIPDGKKIFAEIAAGHIVVKDPFAAAADVPGHLQPVPGEPLTFRVQDIARPRAVTLRPFYTLATEHYAIYWRLTPPDRDGEEGSASQDGE